MISPLALRKIMTEARARARYACEGTRDMVVEPLDGGWVLTVVQRSLDRRWTVREHGRKVAATFRLRPTWLDILTDDDMHHANALFEVLGMRDRVVRDGVGYAWSCGGEVTPIYEGYIIPELPPTPVVEVWEGERCTG